MARLLLLGLLLPAPAGAYEFMTNDSGSSLRWRRPAVPFHVNPANDCGLSDAEVEDAVLDAVEAWEDVGAEVEFEYLGFSDLRDTVYEDGNVVYFTDSWRWDPNLLAMTSNWSYPDGTIVAFDIAVNTSEWLWTVDGDDEGMDLENALVHEFGHVLGLWHTELDDLASMWRSTHPGETQKRDLRPDDQNGLLAIYGARIPMGLACAVAPGTPATGGWIALLLGLVLGGLRRRS